MAKTKRVQVLMEPLEFAALERLARSRGASVADLIRDAARAQYPTSPTVAAERALPSFF
jgi:Ribbon-helix-helix protein, copG family